MNALWVFLGGGIGSVVRYLLGVLLQRSTIHLPLATLLANVLAAMIFALSLRLLSDKLDNANLKFFLLTGICGGLSTFSTFSYETFKLIREGQTEWAIANIIISVVVCIGLFFILVPKSGEA